MYIARWTIPNFLNFSVRQHLFCRTTRTPWRVGGFSSSLWSSSDMDGKMTRLWVFPSRKNLFLTGLRWCYIVIFLKISFPNSLENLFCKHHFQIYPPESRTEESKLQSRLLQKLGLHLYIFICILMLIYVHSMLPLKLKPPLQAMARSPLPSSSPTSLPILFSSAPTSQKIPQM